MFEMGLRRPKQMFLDISCPNEECEISTSQGIAIQSPTELPDIVRYRSKYKYKTCNHIFNDRTGTTYVHTHLTCEQHILIITCQVNGISVRRTAEIACCTPKTY